MRSIEFIVIDMVIVIVIVIVPKLRQEPLRVSGHATPGNLNSNNQALNISSTHQPVSIASGLTKWSLFSAYVQFILTIFSYILKTKRG